MTETDSEDWNVQIADRAKGATLGGAGEFERYDEIRNIRWQTRPARLSAFEESLADALTGALEGGAASLAEIVTRLNDSGVRDTQGRGWTEESLAAELAHLGAV